MLEIRKWFSFGDYSLPSNFSMYTGVVTLINIIMCTNELSGDAFWLCFVSMLWGSTNPLIRKGSKGIEDIHRAGRIRQFFAEIVFLASNWKVRRISTSSEFCVNLFIKANCILSVSPISAIGTRTTRHFNKRYLCRLITGLTCLYDLFPQYTIPFMLNQCGSVVYYLTLASVGKHVFKMLFLFLLTRKSQLTL